MNTDTTDIYLRFQLGRDEVRLIKLIPGQWSDPIRCQLFRASLDECTSYYALSYVWGSRKTTRLITLNGRPFAATVNLESALRHLRQRHSEGLVIWIDALSINQNDDEERSQQVQLMGKIYRSCIEVIVYLGNNLGS